LRRGDVDKAFAEAAHVFEHEFRTQKCLHVPFEPFCSIADYKESGLTIHSGAQGPSFVRSEIARLLGWAETRCASRCRIRGGYGGKLYIKLEALVTACSMIARRPVKIALTMEEQFYQITSIRRRFASRARRQERPHHGAQYARCSGTAALTPTSARGHP